MTVHEQIADPTGRTVVPQTGWWWNPSEPGRGFAIERRGTNLYVGTFLYDGTGRGVWYSAGGPMSGSSFSANLEQYGGEQSEWGPTTGVTHVGAVGPVTLTFSTSRTATLTWPGRSMSIERFEFVPGGAISGPVGWAPETGWYWNPEESGRGWFVEVQNSTLFLSGFMYDARGQPTWYTSQGAMTTTSLYSGTLNLSAGGKAIGGTNQAPTSSTSQGTVTVQFPTTTTAILTLPGGGTVALTRYSF